VQQKRNEKQQGVTFRRVRGRIIPIALGSAGAATAADAARTKRVYQTSKVAIDRKSFAFQPFSGLQMGDQLVMKTRGGKRIAQARYYVKPGGEGVFSWVGVKRSFRGKGHSQRIAKAGALEMKDKGATFIFNHVVHPGSLLTSYDRKRDRLWKEVRTTKAGESVLEPILKKDAIKQATRWNKQFKKTTILEYYFAKDKGGTRPVFRETKLPKTIRRPIKPFRTTGNKLRMGLGLAVAAGAAASYLAGRKDDQ
jgi:predicted GNAT family acetyltransferase